MRNIQELKEKLEICNESYRIGNEMISDSEYDVLIDELKLLSPNDDFFNKIGIVVAESDSRKVLLPINMASMEKIKNLSEFLKWIRLKKIPIETLFCITPKYDGVSFCSHEKTGKSYTRGDGTYGQSSDEHLKMIDSILNINSYAFGEIIMNRENFKKYTDLYKNPRNMVAGQLNSEDVSDILIDCDYIRYGLDMNINKSEQLDLLNKSQKVKVPYKIVSLNEITEEFIKDLFFEWSKIYEIDGVIIEVDDNTLREYLGRETSSNNPCYARAFKGNFEERKETFINNISWNISKQGYLKPIGNVNPINLDGVTISNVTLNNARYVKDMKIGIGAKVLLIRSGFVIPKVIDVIEPNEASLPINCPSCNSLLQWNSNQVELCCLNENCSSKNLKQIISFFNILGVEEFGEGIIENVFDMGYNSVAKILSLTQNDFEKLEGFGTRRAEIIYSNIHSKTQNIEISKLMHGSGMFSGLGSKKLILLEHFEDVPTIEEIIKIDGFSEKSAKVYIDGLPKFKEFIKGLNLTIKKTEKNVAECNNLHGKTFVFTGYRDVQAETEILKQSGKIGSGISKSTSYLVTKDKNSSSSKIVKAIELGITILSTQDLKEMLK